MKIRFASPSTKSDEKEKRINREAIAKPLFALQVKAKNLLTMTYNSYAFVHKQSGETRFAVTK